MGTRHIYLDYLEFVIVSIRNVCSDCTCVLFPASLARQSYCTRTEPASQFSECLQLQNRRSELPRFLNSLFYLAAIIPSSHFNNQPNMKIELMWKRHHYRRGISDLISEMMLWFLRFKEFISFAFLPIWWKCVAHCNGNVVIVNHG